MALATTSQPRTIFQLTRLVDSLTYTFHHTLGTRQSSIYTRSDHAGIKVIFDAKFGWPTWDEETGQLTGRVWDVTPEEQGGEPPKRIWVSRKGFKSYVYEISWVDGKDGEGGGA